MDIITLPSFSRFDENGHFHAQPLLDQLLVDGTQHQQRAQRDPWKNIQNFFFLNFKFELLKISKNYWNEWK